MPKIPAIPGEAALAMASRAQQAARGAGDVRSAFGAKAAGLARLSAVAQVHVMNAAIGATAAAGEVPMVPVSSLPGGMKTIEALVVPAVCAEVLSTMPEARRPGAFGSPNSESDEEYVSWLSGAAASAAEAVRMLGASYWLTRPSISPSVYLPLCFAPALYPRPLERH